MKQQASNNPVIGFRYLLRGFDLIKQPGLRRYVAIPLFINIFIFTGMLWLGIDQFDTLMDRYLPEQELPGWLPDWQWLTYLLEPFRWLAWLFFSLAFVLIFFYGFTLVANLIGAPFNDMLAAKVEAMLSGQKPDDSGSILKAVGPSITQELYKLAYFVSRGIPMLILFVIPGVNLIAPLAWGLFSAWSLANEYIEYPMGNHQIRFKAQRHFMKKRRLSAFGFGGGIMLIMAIPIINFTAMPVAVCGATAWWSERLKEKFGQEHLQ